jgi:hypothetical protein
MLTDAEAQQIGQSYASAAATEELLEGVCMFSAVFSASLSGGDPAADPSAAPTAEQIAACNDAFAMCQMQIQQAQGQAAPPPMGGMTVPSSASAFADCDVTVEQYEACLTASIAMLEQLYSGLSCDQPAMLDSTAAAMSPTECQAFSMCSAAATSG